MTLRRRVWLPLAGFTVVGLALVAWRAQTAGAKYSREQFDRIKMGMTSAEVLSIMGLDLCPPSEWAEEHSGKRGDMWLHISDECARGRTDVAEFDTWIDARQEIRVTYGADHCVIGKFLYRRTRPWQITGLRWLARLRRFLGL